MFRAKSIKEMNFIVDIDTNPYWNYSPEFIVTYYKIFELLGYQDNKEKCLCLAQLNIIKSLISPTEYKYAEISANKHAEIAIKKYSYGNNPLKIHDYKIA